MFTRSSSSCRAYCPLEDEEDERELAKLFTRRGIRINSTTVDGTEVKGDRVAGCAYRPRAPVGRASPDGRGRALLLAARLSSRTAILGLEDFLGAWRRTGAHHGWTEQDCRPNVRHLRDPGHSRKDPAGPPPAYAQAEMVPDEVIAGHPDPTRSTTKAFPRAAPTPGPQGRGDRARTGSPQWAREGGGRRGECRASFPSARNGKRAKGARGGELRTDRSRIAADRPPRRRGILGVHMTGPGPGPRMIGRGFSASGGGTLEATADPRCAGLSRSTRPDPLRGDRRGPAARVRGASRFNIVNKMGCRLPLFRLRHRPSHVS